MNRRQSHTLPWAFLLFLLPLVPTPAPAVRMADGAVISATSSSPLSKMDPLGDCSRTMPLSDRICSISLGITLRPPRKIMSSARPATRLIRASVRPQAHASVVREARSPVR